MAEGTKEIERIYIVPLRDAKHGRSSLSAPHAVKNVQDFLTKHMKVTKDKIWIDDSINKALWASGKYHIPSKIRVRAVKFEDGVVEVSLPELEVKKSRRELLKEEREKKEPILRKEEKEEGEEKSSETGAEDVTITPAADGDVKIKKKKAPKKTKEQEVTNTEKPKKEKKSKEKTAEEPATPKKKKKTSSKKSEKTTASKTKRKSSPKKET